MMDSVTYDRGASMCIYDTSPCAKSLKKASQFKCQLLSKRVLNRSSCAILRVPLSHVETWMRCLVPGPVQQSLGSDGTHSQGNLLSVSMRGKLTGAQRFKRVSNSEGNRAAFVWSSLAPKVGKKWKHISPLTASVDLTPPPSPLPSSLWCCEA